MIKYNNKTINDWYFDNKNIIKVYKNNAVCYYKIVSGGVTPSQEPCFAVVDDISSYQDREFVDVYDKATEKWYKLNNLNQYEQYGVYGEGRNITYYVGKLTIDEGYEYEWDGSQWVNLGEVEGSSRVPNGYTEVEYITTESNSTTGYGAFINTNFIPNQNTRVIMDFQVVSTARIQHRRIFGSGNYNILGYIVELENYIGESNGYYYYKFGQTSSWYKTTVRTDKNRHTVDYNRDGKFYLDETSIVTLPNNTFTCQYPLGLFGTMVSNSNISSGEQLVGRVWSCKVYDNGTLVRDFVPCKRDSDTTYGMYDIVNNVFYPSYNSVKFSGGEESGYVVYPKYYSEMEEPENNLTFATMEEALAYECPWVGMIATIGTDLYKFNANNEWEKLSFTITGVTRASEAFKIKLNNADADATIFQDNGDGTYNFGVVYIDPITETTSMASGNTNLVKFDFSNADISNLTTIGNNTFNNCSNLTTFEIPDGIATISSYAFYNCNNYIDIKIPESITRVDSYAFYRSSSSTYRRVYITDLSKWCNIYISDYYANPLYNGNLYLNNSLVTTLTLPSDITQVKKYTFSGCKSIQTLNIPDNITSLSEVGYGSTFYYCSNLSTINWGTGLTRLEQYTFYGTAIRTLNIPNGITSIEGNCFAYCNNLQTVTMPDSVTRISDYVFSYNYNTTSLTLSQNLTSIGSYAFYQNRSLKTLTIPSKVTDIYNSAFAYCSGLTSITIEATTPPTLGTNVFDNTNDCPIYVPCASVNAYRTATNWSAYADRILGFESCTTYDWQTISGEYVCDDGNKYEVEKYVRSFDNGTTWEDVTPLQTRKGALIAEGVPECVQKTYTDGTYTYNALQDVTVPQKSVYNDYNLYVPYDFEPNYKYSVEFTPLNFWTESYYGFIVGNGNTSYSLRETPEFHVFKMDNGWGSQFFRFGCTLHNYSMGTRSGQGLPGAWTVYENVRAKIETHLVNYAAGNGATITVENEGYATYTGTSTKTVTSSWSPTYGVKNICLFGAYPANNFSANMKFHNFAVKTSTDELVYNYVPVERQSDGKLGVFDTVHNIFYLANDYLALVAGDYVYGE